MNLLLTAFIVAFFITSKLELGYTDIYKLYQPLSKIPFSDQSNCNATSKFSGFLFMVIALIDR